MERNIWHFSMWLPFGNAFCEYVFAERTFGAGGMDRERLQCLTVATIW